MFKTTAVIRALIGVSMVLVVAIPASAQTGSTNVLVASGVTFLPAQDEAIELAAIDTAVPLRFDAPMAGVNAFAPRQGEDKHIFGAGLRTGGYGFGIGAMARYWFTQQWFVDAAISHYGYSYVGLTGFSQNTFSGSLLYMFKKIDTNDAIVFRIYAGGGVNVSTWNYNDGLTPSETAVGGQVLAGVEMIVKQLPQLGFGLDLGWHSGNDDLLYVTGIGGLGSTIYAVWYFK